MKEQTKNKINKLLSRLVTVLLVLSVLLCLWVVAQTVLRGYVSLFGYSFFRVTTPSMEPVLPVGTLILTHKEDISSIETEQIVSFVSKEKYLNGRIITHRVIDKQISESGKVLLTTRGDANPSADMYFVDKENLVGRLVWQSEEGNFLAVIIGFLSGKTGFFTCIVIPIILIVAVMVKRSVSSMTKEIKKIKEAMEQSEDEEGFSQEEISEQETVSREESYEEMRSRIRAELEEELKRENDREKHKKE